MASATWHPDIRHREKQVEVGKYMVNISIIYRVLYTRYMIYPKGSHGTWYIYLHEWLIFMVNVGKYTIHGSSGYEPMNEEIRHREKQVEDGTL